MQRGQKNEPLPYLYGFLRQPELQTDRLLQPSNAIFLEAPLTECILRFEIPRSNLQMKNSKRIHPRLIPFRFYADVL